MRINTVQTEASIVNGPGFRIPIYVQGCGHGCPSCHNPQTHDRNAGYCISPKALAGIILGHLEDDPLLTGITWSGGEPYDQIDDVNAVNELIVRERPDINIMLYTGYVMTPERLGKLRHVEYVVDGPFILAQRDIGLKFRGSANQQVWQKVNGEYRNITELWG